MAKVKISLPEEMSLSQCRDRIAKVDLELARLEREKAPLREKIGEIDKALSRLHNEKRLLEHRREELSGKPHVSDHAVLRYIERHYGIDVESLRKEILTPKVIAAINAGARAIKIDGTTIKISGTTVVTYFD